jgi:hypothetical protein
LSTRPSEEPRFDLLFGEGRQAARNLIWHAQSAEDGRGAWLAGGWVAPGHLLPERFTLAAGATSAEANEIWRIIRGLIPIGQALDLIPIIWKNSGLGQMAVSEHVEELLDLAQCNPAAADLVQRGKLIEAELMVLGDARWVELVRRHYVIWLIADVFRTARLVLSVDATAKKIISLNAALVSPFVANQAAEKSDTVFAWTKVGAVAGDSEDRLKMLRTLPDYPTEDGRRPAFREKQIFIDLHKATMTSPKVPDVKERLAEEDIDYRVDLMKYVPRTDDNIRAIGRIRKDPRKRPRKHGKPSPKKTPKADMRLSELTVVEAVLGVAPMPGILMVAALATDVLNRLQLSNLPPTNAILRDLTCAPWPGKNVRVSSDLYLMIQLIRVHWFDLGAGRDSLTPWKTADLGDPAVLKSARSELRSEDRLQHSMREAAQKIARYSTGKPVAIQRRYNFPAVRAVFDLSARYRTEPS